MMMRSHCEMKNSQQITKIHTGTTNGDQRVGVLPNVRIFTTPWHPDEYVIDEIEGGRSVDIPLQCGQHQQFPVL